jgi:hypothetical protein
VLPLVDGYKSVQRILQYPVFCEFCRNSNFLFSWISLNADRALYPVMKSNDQINTTREFWRNSNFLFSWISLNADRALYPVMKSNDQIKKIIIYKKIL